MGSDRSKVLITLAIPLSNGLFSTLNGAFYHLIQTGSAN